MLDDVAESNKLGKRFLIAVKSSKSILAATGCAESVRASLSLSNNSTFPLTSLVGETKYLKQLKIQGTMKHFGKKKTGLIVPLNLLESVYGNEFFHSRLKKGNIHFQVASKSIIFKSRSIRNFFSNTKVEIWLKFFE